jgi:hypothetical protein
MAVLEQIPNDGAPRLAAAAGDRDLCHVGILSSGLARPGCACGRPRVVLVPRGAYCRIEGRK